MRNRARLGTVHRARRNRCTLQQVVAKATGDAWPIIGPGRTSPQHVFHVEAPHRKAVGYGETGINPDDLEVDSAVAQG